MAPALRMTRPGLLGAGPFGQRVAGLLSHTFPDSLTLRADMLEEGFAGADVVVIALWRPAPALCERADLLAHESGTPWLPIIMRHPVVLAGPLVRPGRGPCFRCYQRRLIQHDKDSANTQAVHAAYDRDPSYGPRGFLPSHARMAAGIAARLLGDEQAAGTGEVVSFSLTEQRIRRDAVVSCHGCDRCTVVTAVGGLTRRLVDARRAYARQT